MVKRMVNVVVRGILSPSFSPCSLFPTLLPYPNFTFSFTLTFTLTFIFTFTFTCTCTFT